MKNVPTVFPRLVRNGLQSESLRKYEAYVVVIVAKPLQ